jgi:DNA-binding response OmpR family regulator
LDSGWPVCRKANRDEATGMRILLIDDDPMTARGLALCLNSHGHEVQIGGCVADAVAVCAAGEPFDVLITDLLLPDGTGWDLLQRVRVSSVAVASVVVSGYSRPEDVAASLAAGFDAHCVKPDDLPRLPDLVHRLARRERRRQRRSASMVGPATGAAQETC